MIVEKMCSRVMFTKRSFDLYWHITLISVPGAQSILALAMAFPMCCVRELQLRTITGAALSFIVDIPEACQNSGTLDPLIRRAALAEQSFEHLAAIRVEQLSPLSSPAIRVERSSKRWVVLY